MSANQTVGIDLATLAVAVGQRLHDADMEVTPEQAERFALSLQLTRPRTHTALYHTTRAIFVTDVEQMETFDRVFAEIFGAPAATRSSDAGAAAALTPAQA